MTMQIKELANSPPRAGRTLQRYNQGYRQVVGCIPYRIRQTNKLPSIEDLEILLISSQKSPRMMFPKGGWELDEDIELAASRETLEEAGVIGLLGDKLGEWIFKSKSQEKYHEATMFPMFVTEELDVWPEKNVRSRVWMTISEARERCSHSWMKEALEAFVTQFTQTRTEDEALEAIVVDSHLDQERKLKLWKPLFVNSFLNQEWKTKLWMPLLANSLFSLQWSTKLWCPLFKSILIRQESNTKL